jgi:AraC family transcriptional regulator of adaptative response / DNA-3-methyladenine glycosylase II
MTEVALASGFGSLRRFNETFQQLYDRPPSALRRASVAEVSASAAGAVSLMLPYRAPYDWDALIGFLAMRAIPGVEAVSPRRYARTIGLAGAAGVLVVEPASGERLAVTVRFPRLDALPTIIARVRAVFDLAADPLAIAEHLGRDPILAPMVAARPGLRVPGAWDGFELAVRAILGQQITVVAARKLAGRIVEAWGEPLPPAAGDIEGLTRVFPSPERLADADIAALGMPRSRGAALNGLARAARDDPRIFGPQRGLDEAIAQLKAMPGVGEWTAQYIAMRQLREPDAFPAADVGLMRALAGPDGARPSPAKLLERAERWRPWRAYAALHLWTSLSHANGDPR